jgi:site-specific recombinase XerD
MYYNLVKSNKFIGNQPKTLEYENMHFLSNDYLVCDKADGERVFLIYTKYNGNFLLNTKIQVISRYMSSNNYGISLIDGEYIKEQLSKIENIKHKSILSLTYSVGLRVSEVINLKIEDIDSKRMIIHIKNAKGRKDRVVPLSQKVLELLREYFKEYRPIKYLFNGQNSLKYSSGSCNQIVKKYLGEKYHIHQLRHSCATNLLENGTDLKIIQKILGHSNVKTTEIYTHVSNQLLSKVNLPI